MYRVPMICLVAFVATAARADRTPVAQDAQVYFAAPQFHIGDA